MDTAVSNDDTVYSSLFLLGGINERTEGKPEQSTNTIRIWNLLYMRTEISYTDLMTDVLMYFFNSEPHGAECQSTDQSEYHLCCIWMVEPLYGQRGEPELQELLMLFFILLCPYLVCGRKMSFSTMLTSLTSHFWSVHRASYSLSPPPAPVEAFHLFLEMSAVPAWAPRAAWAPTSLRGCSQTERERNAGREMSGWTLTSAALNSHGVSVFCTKGVMQRKNDHANKESNGSIISSSCAVVINKQDCPA